MFFKRNKAVFQPQALVEEIDKLRDMLSHLEALYLSRANAGSDAEGSLRAVEDIRRGNELLERCAAGLGVTLPPKDARKLKIYLREQARILSALAEICNDHELYSLGGVGRITALCSELCEKQIELASV